jgi:hypothetical protein
VHIVRKGNGVWVWRADVARGMTSFARFVATCDAVSIT